ncbi:MAG: NINE protein [Ginsengibacter sp.]
MQYDKSSSPINPVLLNLLYDVTPEELLTINSNTKGFGEEDLSYFCMIYRSKRKDPQTILLLCLLGLVFVAGIHRFVIGHTGLGVLYFFTAGLCWIGTIVDAINHKNLALEYNAKMISETLLMLNMVRKQ